MAQAAGQSGPLQDRTLQHLIALLDTVTDTAAIAANRLAEFLHGELGHADYVPLHSPALEGREKEYLAECVDTGWLSSVGPFVDRFEAAVAEACGTRHAVATVNGTAAQHAALVGLGVGPGDAVVVPALSFIATANAVSYTGATPIFADIDRATLGLAAESVERLLAHDCESSGGRRVHKASGRRIAAVVAVDIFGHPADMDALRVICADYGLPLVEDAAEALGSSRGGRPCGSLGHVGILSFNGNKIVTSGGGGMVMTDDSALAQTLKHLTTTARKPHSLAYDHDAVGFNYRLPNVNAALGMAQLENLSSFVARKRRLAVLYRDLFADLKGVSLVDEPEDCASNYWLNTLVFDDLRSVTPFVTACEERGIMTRPAWRLLAETSVYRDAPVAGDLAVARDVAPRLVNIPSSAWLLPRANG